MDSRTGTVAASWNQGSERDAAGGGDMTGTGGREGGSRGFERLSRWKARDKLWLASRRSVEEEDLARGRGRRRTWEARGSCAGCDLGRPQTDGKPPGRPTYDDMSTLRSF